MTGPPRKGARRVADIPADILTAMNEGQIETRSLVEMYAIDFAALLDRVAPGLGASMPTASRSGSGITQRMAMAGQMLLEAEGPVVVQRLVTHPSDIVRGWGAYALGAIEDIDLRERLARVRPFAADSHFGVREWAWLAQREHITADIDAALGLLRPWTAEDQDTLRRFAVESTRPRGVWCRHIAVLKADPQRGLPLLEPLRADPSRYVQDSVANWLNDAARSDPEWVRAVCARWLTEQGELNPATERLCRRAQRSLPDA